MRVLAEQAFSRAAGAPLVPGNSIRLLKDARENYPAWLDAIARATRFIHFESYIIHDDAVGEQFSDALIARAREGVHVRVIYDWMGGFGKTSRRFWNGLRRGGVEVRCYNAPTPTSPFGWLSRDHRKMLGVDGTVGFVSGLCVGQAWVGNPARGIPPWRHTGVEVRGPAVRQIEGAFAQMWALIGDPLPDASGVTADTSPPAGNTPLRVVATVPNTAGLFRLGQLVAAIARKRLWLTDAYYAGTPLYVQGLRSAAQDGVESDCSCRTGRTSHSSARCRRPGIARCWRRACASSSGTAPCCTRRPRSQTAGGHGWARPISTLRAGSVIASSMSSSRTTRSPSTWKRCTWKT
jgi:cardiolipin synthase A/B